jgi:hypothetical protein
MFGTEGKHYVLPTSSQVRRSHDKPARLLAQREFEYNYGPEDKRS